MYVCMCFTCVQFPQRSESTHWLPGTIVTSGHEHPYGGWELNPHPLQEQMLLITEPSLQPLCFNFVYAPRDYKGEVPRPQSPGVALGVRAVEILQVPTESRFCTA